MQPYAELLYYNQLNPNTQSTRRIRDAFKLKEPEDIIEFAGRWDYGEKNARKLGEKSKMAPDRFCITLPSGDCVSSDCMHTGRVVDEPVSIIQKYISMGHESMIELGDATFFLECSRVVSHEIVRHRLASFQQESQRFVSYRDDEDLETLTYIPEGSGEDKELFMTAIALAKDTYNKLVDKGFAKQLARYVLPNSMRTRIIMKTNTREWRHILKLRLDKSAQPEMQQLMQQVYDQLVEIYPNALHGILEGTRGVR